MFAQIESIASHLPSGVLDNAQLAQPGAWTEGDIFAKTGIRRRHVAAENECASDLAIAAVQQLQAQSKFAADSIEFLILCTQTPDYILPTTACIVQTATGLPTTCAAFDVSLGCSGYVYALSVAAAFIGSGTFQRGIVVTADTYTRYVHPQDRSTRTIFGDGATATLLQASETEGLRGFSFGTDGRGAKNLIIPAGGTRLARGVESKAETTDKSGNIRTLENLYMNGPEIFTFTLQRVPEIISQTLGKSGLRMEDIDCFVFHQANQFMLDHLRKKLGISPERMIGRLEDIGNTVSSSIPFAIESGIKSGQILAGMKVMLVGFGVGYSWACAIWKVNGLT